MSSQRNEQTHQINVLIIGTHDLFRDSLENLLSIQTDMQLVGTAVTTHEALEMLTKLHADVILIDLSMNEMETLTSIHKIHELHPKKPIVAMSGFPTNEVIEQLMSAGVKHFIKRGAPATAIVNAVRDLAASAVEPLTSQKGD